MTSAERRVQVLRRLAAVLEARSGAHAAGAASPEDLGLTALLLADLDRHLTALVDDRYPAESDALVEEIERVIDVVRGGIAGRPVR